LRFVTKSEVQPADSLRLVRNQTHPSGEMLNYAYAFALLAVVLGLAFVGARLFLWLVFFVTSLIPLAGKRHRHSRWDEFNGPHP
jgi:hypothetical protein